MAIVEVTEDSLMTSVPDIGTWHSGPLNAVSRCFDVVCSGNCELGSSNQKLKLDFQPADEIPDFFTKNREGKIIFAESKPMVTISSPKGHNAWLKIDLVKINGQFSDAEKYVCLGIKKHSEDEYYDILHMGNSTRYVDVMDGDPVELIPLLSGTDIASEVTLVTSGEEVTPANFGVSGNSFDFGSVYRINTGVQDGQWITETCELSEIGFNNTSVCVGPINNKDNQMVTVAPDGSLFYSSNGIHWNKTDVQFKPIDIVKIAHGNGTWCIINGIVAISGPHNSVDYNFRYSVDRGETWANHSMISLPYYGVRAFTFSDEKFVTIDTNKYIHISRDAVLWNSYKGIFSGWVRFLVYGNKKWLAGSDKNIYESEDGINWTLVPSELSNFSDIIGDYGVNSCFVNGYFYVISLAGVLVRSSDGRHWEKVGQFSGNNITYYKNKLYIFFLGDNGIACHIGFPNP